MTDLMELASRVEAGEGPDRELDAWIWWVTGTLAALCPETTKQSSPALAVGYYSGGRPRIPDDELTMADVTPAYKCPTYTASLDAAMTLVPEGWDFTIEPRYALVVLDDGWNLARFEAKAATPARALTAAIIRARAHQGAAHVDQ